MAKHKIDEAREERIQLEVVVDCYNTNRNAIPLGSATSKTSWNFPFGRAVSRREKLHHSKVEKRWK